MTRTNAMAGHEDTVRAALAALCAEGRPSLSRPFRLTIDGEPWTAASDGRSMLAVRGDFDGAECQMDAEKIVAWLRPRAVPPVRIRVGALLDALPAFVPPTRENCTICSGTGTRVCGDCLGVGECTCDKCEADHDCGTCDGAGVVPCTECTTVKPAKIALGDTVYDANVLRPVLSAFPASVADYWPGGTSERRAEKLLLVGDDWRALAMPLLGNPEWYPRIDLAACVEGRSDA